MGEEYIIHGPKGWTLPQNSFGKFIYERLLAVKDVPVALADSESEVTISYKELLERSCRLAEWMKTKLKMNQNDVVGIFSENNISYAIPMIASLFLGVPVTTFNPQYTAGELTHSLNLSQPSVMFCSEWALDTFMEVKPNAKFIKTVILIDSEEEKNLGEIVSLSQIYSDVSNVDVTDFQPSDVSSIDQTALILYSSGTTGLPKGVMITHRNIHYVNNYFIDPRYKQPEKPGQDTVNGFLPFFHYFGLVSLLLSLTGGRRIIVMKSFNPEAFLQSIQDFGITVLFIVPPLANFLVNSPLVDNYDLSSIKIIICASAPLSKKIEDSLIKRLNVTTFLQGYGLTEASPILGFSVNSYKAGSCGTVLPGASVKVVDVESGKALGPGQAGELCCKGDVVMKGYINNIEATKAAFDKDGWFHTGDVTYYDEERYFFYVDRIKELIKYKAFQVAPAELEAILLTHPKINDAGVVGIPDERAGELPMAFVVVEENVTEKEIQQFLAKQVSPQKQLRGGVRFIDEIPRNPSGKILRRKLKELLNGIKSKL